MQARVDQAQDELHKLEHEQSELRRGFYRELRARRTQLIFETRVELRDKLREQRAELPRLRRQRKRLESP